MRSDTLSRLVLSSLAVGCGGNARETSAPPPVAAAASCDPRDGDKLGVPFVHLCLPGRHDEWVAATPLTCSAGDHEVLECPLVTPLVAEPALGPQALAPRAAVVTDATTAHRTCAMRFGGRLPTPAERLELRRVQGLAALVVSGDPAGAMHLIELDEWTESGTCDNPSQPGDGCSFERFPGAASGPLDWGAMLRCQTRPAPPGARPEDATPPSGECRPPCLVVSPWLPGTNAAPKLVELACERPPSPPLHPVARGDVAAFRCILPAASVTPRAQ